MGEGRGATFHKTVIQFSLSYKLLGPFVNRTKNSIAFIKIKNLDGHPYVFAIKLIL